jgi:DNA-binding LytR/AlgR family response regulator
MFDLLICEIRFLGESVYPLLQKVKFMTQISSKTTQILVISTCHPLKLAENLTVKVEGYLLKPISPERFQKAMERALERLEQERILEQTGQDSGFLTFRVDRKVHRMPFQRILYLQALDDYVKIISSEGTLLPKITLTQLEKELPGHLFLRIHRSYIINLKHVQDFDHQEVGLGQRKLPIGKSFREQVLARLKTEVN